MGSRRTRGDRTRWKVRDGKGYRKLNKDILSYLGDDTRKTLGKIQKEV